MKNFIYSFLFSSLFLIACNDTKDTDDDLERIPIETAFENQTELKASDIFKEITYIPLETNENSVVGQAPYVQLIHDKIVITTRNKQCLVFDKATGKFLTQVGHVGNDPEGYRNTNCWIDYNEGILHFPAYKSDKWVRYNLEGVYSGELKVPVGSIPSASRIISQKDGRYVSHPVNLETDGSKLIFFRDNQIEATRVLIAESGSINTSEIASMNIMGREEDMKIYGPTTNEGVIIINYKDPERVTLQMNGNTGFWKQGEDIYFKDTYNDTIYQVKDTLLYPSYLLDLGKYHWEHADRERKNMDNNFLITQILDSKEQMIIRFIQHIFNKPQLYNVAYDKTSGTTKAAPYSEGWEDDLTNFLPLQPMTVTPSGEYVGLLQPMDIVEWFEENENVSLSPQVEALKQLAEDDNPVVVIMK